MGEGNPGAGPARHGRLQDLGYCGQCKLRLETGSDLADVISFCLDILARTASALGGTGRFCTLRASYSQWLDALKWIVRDRSQEFQRKLFYENGVCIYGI